MRGSERLIGVVMRNYADAMRPTQVCLVRITAGVSVVLTVVSAQQTADPDAFWVVG